MEIVYRNLADLVPNPKNPRQQGPDGIEGLAESIKNNPAFFEARPVLLSNRTGKLVIIAGERRSEAARYLEMEKVPTILMEGLTEEQEDEIMVRDNTHSGRWDENALRVWSNEQLEKWNAPKWSAVDEEKVNALFEQSKGEKKEKPFYILIESPASYKGKREEIIEAIKAVIERWPGLTIR